jgi:DNA-binding NarL/FixJ family response regulator
MECHARRAKVWFSTFKENGSSKLAAIIADVTKEQPAPLFPPIRAGRRRAAGTQPPATCRQRLVFQGLHNTGIEQRLQMTPSAVKSILPQLFSKAEAKNRIRGTVAKPSRCRSSAATSKI